MSEATDTLTDDVLATLFQEGLLPGVGSPPVDMDRIFAVLEGEAPLDERLAVIDLTTSDPAWADAWQTAKKVLELRKEDSPSGVSPIGVPEPANTPTRWPAFLAAGIAVAAALFLVLRVTPTSPPDYRATHVAKVLSVSEGVSRAAPVLAWKGLPEGAHVTVTVTDASLLPVARAEGMDLASLDLTEKQLAKVAVGDELLWQVRWTDADGGVHQSPTFRTRRED